MDELVRWLTACLDEDERIARAATPGPWWHNPGKQWLGPEAFEKYDLRQGEEFVGYGSPHPFTGAVASTGPASNAQGMKDAAFIAAHDPARVLREIDAKRRIVAAYLPPGGDPHPGLPCTDDIEGDPDGVFYAEQHPADQGACVRHLEASKRLLHHDYVLRLLALPYADRPGYEERWAP